MLLKKVTELAPFFILILLVLAGYSLVHFGFFQQDEWLGFARHILLSDMEARELLGNIFTPYSAHYVPLTFLSINLLFFLFNLNYLGYAIVSIGFHIITVMLVFYLTKLLLKNDFFALAAAGLFGVSAAGYQATAWMVADIATHGAAIFGLLSLIFVLNFLSSRKTFLLILIIVFLLISLLFKEITIGLFLITPLMFYLYADKSLKSKARFPWIFFGIFVLYFVFRVIMFMGSPFNLTSAEGINRDYLFSNTVAYPVKTVVQTAIPPGQIIQLSDWLTSGLPEDIRGEKGTTAFDIFAQGRVLPIMELLLFLLIGAGTFVLWKRSKDADFRRILLFSFFFIVINSVVYVLSPERTDLISLIDSRNLYFPSIGTSILIVAILMKIAKANFKKAFFLLLPIFLINVFWLKEINSLVQFGSLRREILSHIKATYPDLPDKVVFYTESDTSYFGLLPEEKIMPFQSGFGQTLLVWYYTTEEWPNEFLQDRFLWEITEQGYREYNGRGFGYFRDYEMLKDTLQDYKLKEDSIISFSWSSKYNALVDTTEKLREELR